MAGSWLDSFSVALGFEVDTGSLNTAKKSVADYEKAVKDAEKRIEDARWEGAKTEEEIAKLTRETNLREARAALANAQDKEKAEKEQAKKRQERAREFSAAMSSMAIAAAAAATAIGYAVAKVAGSFDNLYFQAQRSGTSVQSLKALGYAFSQTGSTAQEAGALVDSFTTKLRNNPGLRQFVKDLGVDENLEGAAKVMATVEALRKEPYEVGVQHAEMLGISEERFNHIVRQSDAIKEYREQYNATTKLVGLNSEEAAKAATSFQRSMTRLQATVSVIGEKLIVQLAPALEKVAKGFTDWLAANPEKVDHILKSISDAIVWLSQKITALVEWFAGSDGEAFLKRWDDFSARVGAIAHGFEVVWGVLQKVDAWLESSVIWRFIKDWAALVGSGRFGLGGAIQDYLTGRGGGGGGGALGVGAVGGFNPLEGGGSGGGAGATPPDDRTTWQKYAPKILGGKDAPAAGDGSRSFRNNNPGNIKYGPFAEKMGATGKDEKGFARFPSYEAGRKAQENLLFEDERYKGLTIRQAIAKYAPAGDGNEPEGYANEMAKAAGAGPDAKMADLTPDQRGRFLDAQQAKEGWIPAAPRSASDAPAPAGTRRITEGVTTITSQSGRSFQVAREFAANFKGFIDDYEKAGGVIGKASGGLNERPSNASYHPVGRAIDINQIGRGVRSRDQNLPLDVEEALAAKWGLRSGNSFRSNDNGHFEVHNAAVARAAIEALHAGEQRERAATRALTAQPAAPDAPRLPKPNMTPGGFDVNKIDPGDLMKAPPLGANSVNNSTANDNRAVHQTFNTNTTINEARNTKEAGRAMEGTFGRMHSMALANAQSAVA